jgi:hypothetical protein
MDNQPTKKRGGARPGSGAPRKFTEDKNIAIRFPVQMITEIDKKSMGRNRSECIREAVSLWLKK